MRLKPYDSIVYRCRRFLRRCVRVCSHLVCMTRPAFKTMLDRRSIRVPPPSSMRARINAHTNLLAHPQTEKMMKASDSVMLAAIGGPKWDGNPRDKRPETGLLKMRKSLGLFANLRPAIVLPQLVEASTLKPEVVSGVDIMVVRELTGDVYFGMVPLKRRALLPSATPLEPLASGCSRLLCEPFSVCFIRNAALWVLCRCSQSRAGACGDVQIDACARSHACRPPDLQVAACVCMCTICVFL